MTVDRDALLRPYREGDETEIQAAFAEVFGRRRPFAEWHWKFVEPPQGSRTLLAFDADARLVCQYAAVALDVSWFGERILAGQIVDVLSRGRSALGRRGGPFLRTVKTFLETFGGPGGFSFIFGFPGERHQRLGALAGIYNETSPIECLRRELPGRSAVAARRALQFFEGYDAHALARLWRRAAPRYRAAAVRDERWFAWRYAARPGFDYRQIGLRREGETRAWAVLACDREAARWVDLLWDGEDPRDLIALADELASRALAEGASRLELWLRGDGAARAALLGSGFASGVDPERQLSAIVFDPRTPLDRVFGDFYLTLGDSDHV